MDNENVHFTVEEESTSYDKGRDFTFLKAWRKAREVKLFFYDKVLSKLPNEENYQLGNQIRNAAVSSTANIAEGYGRFHYQEGIQFYRIARGSLYELKDHLITCNDLGYIKTKLFKEGLFLIEESKKILNGYINFVKKQKQTSRI